MNLVAVAIAAVVALGPTVLAKADETRATSDDPANAQLTRREPVLLKSIAAAGWRLAKARAALPLAQVVQEERLEIQDFIQYAYDGGSFRLCVSRGREGGDIFAVIVDTRRPQYKDFVGLWSTDRYVTYHSGPHVVVIPLRSLNPQLFETLKSRKWTDAELKERLGAPSYRWHVHGVGYSGMTYAPQGLRLIGVSPWAGKPVEYQVYSSLDPGTSDLPPLNALSKLDYGEVAIETQRDVAQRLAAQRKEIEEALARGTRSPDGRFVVSRVNLGGTFNNEQVVIGERGKPERRYPAGYFTEDADYRWLDRRTVLRRVSWGAGNVEFYTMDAMTGAEKPAASVADEDSNRVTDFGVFTGRRFWYKTADGNKHEVAVPAPKRAAQPGLRKGN